MALWTYKLNARYLLFYKLILLSSFLGVDVTLRLQFTRSLFNLYIIYVIVKDKFDLCKELYVSIR